MTYTVHTGDCLDVMRTLDANSIDAVVSDPPYGLSFMGKAWDHAVPGVEFWAEALRVAKPGAHLLAFGGTRLYHRLACAIEDAGWEIRDCVMWVYGQGFPKGLNVVRQMATMALCQSPEHARCVAQSSQRIQAESSGARAPIAAVLARILPEGDLVLITETGGVVGLSEATDTLLSELTERTGLSTTWSWNGSLEDACTGTSRCITETETAPITDPKTYSWLIGLHTSGITTLASETLRNGLAWPAINVRRYSTEGLLKPSVIPVAIAVGSATWNPVVKYAGYNAALKPAWEPIIMARKPLEGTVAANVTEWGTGGINVDGCRVEGVPPSVPQPSFSRDMRAGFGASNGRCGEMSHASGRWPANLIHDGSDEVLAGFPVTGPAKASDRGAGKGETGCYGAYGGNPGVRGHDDNGGSAARFFYCAKASKADRDEGCEGLEAKRTPRGSSNNLKQWEAGERTYEELDEKSKSLATIARNTHPTVKPTDLMRYLCRLVTPPGGVILDPFTGSGSTGKAAMLEGFDFIGIELDPTHAETARLRIERARTEAGPFEVAV